MCVLGEKIPPIGVSLDSGLCSSATDSEDEQAKAPGSLALSESTKSTECSDSGDESSMNNTLLKDRARPAPVQMSTSATSILSTAAASADADARLTQNEEHSDAGACHGDGHFVEGWSVAQRRRLFEN